MKLAVSNIAWAPEDRFAAYHLLADAGFDGLEIAPTLFFHAAGDPFDPAASVAKKAMDELLETGLSLVSMQSLLFGVQGAAMFEGPEELNRLESGMIRAIDLAGRFGIPNLVFGSPGQRRIPEGLALEQAVDKAAALFLRLGDRARAAGTVIGVEPNPVAYGTNFLNTLDQAHEFVSHVNHPAITLTLDLGSMRLNNQFDGIGARITKVGSRLSHVHFSEPYLTPAPASFGQTKEVLSALSIIGYDRAVSIEMKAQQDGINALAPCVERLNSAALGMMMR